MEIILFRKRGILLIFLWMIFYDNKMKNVSHSEHIALQILQSIEGKVWGKVSSTKSRNNISSNASKFGFKAAQTLIVSSLTKADRIYSSMVECEEFTLVKETQLVNAVPRQFSPNTVFKARQNVEDIKSRAQASVDNDSNQTAGGRSHENIQGKGKNQSPSALLSNSCVPLSLNESLDNTLDLLRKNRLEADRRKENQARLQELKKKAKLDREISLRKKLKEMKVTHYGFDGQIEATNSPSTRMLTPNIKLNDGVEKQQEFEAKKQFTQHNFIKTSNKASNRCLSDKNYQLQNKIETKALSGSCHTNSDEKILFTPTTYRHEVISSLQHRDSAKNINCEFKKSYNKSSPLLTKRESTFRKFIKLEQTSSKLRSKSSNQRSQEKLNCQKVLITQTQTSRSYQQKHQKPMKTSKKEVFVFKNHFQQKRRRSNSKIHVVSNKKILSELFS